MCEYTRPDLSICAFFIRRLLRNSGRHCPILVTLGSSPIANESHKAGVDIYDFVTNACENLS